MNPPHPNPIFLPALLAMALANAPAAQNAPTYDLTFLGPANGISALSENGVVVGQRSVGNATRGWVGSAASAPQLLPLAPGYQSSWANDINEQGVIVGAASTSGTSPEFGGRAVAWQPDGQGGYVLQELGMLPGHVGSNATAVNNVGDIVGYSKTGMFRYAVWFTSPVGVMDLDPFGVFDPQSLNDQRQFCDRLGKRMDLDTMTVESLGLPPSPPNYQATLGYAINGFGHVAGTAVLTTSTSCVYQAARYRDGTGWQVLSPCSPLASASAINDLDDVIYQAFLIYRILHLEGVGDFDVQTLLAPSDQHWDVLTSFSMDINSARQLAVIATDTTTGQTGAALLTPETPWIDLGGGTSGSGGPSLLTMSGPLTPASVVSLDLIDGAPLELAIVFVSFTSAPSPFLGGTLYTFPFDELVVLGTDSAGGIHGSAFFPGAASGQGLWFQVGIRDLSVPIFGASLSNGVKGIVP